MQDVRFGAEDGWSIFNERCCSSMIDVESTFTDPSRAMIDVTIDDIDADAFAPPNEVSGSLSFEEGHNGLIGRETSDDCSWPVDPIASIENDCVVMELIDCNGEINIFEGIMFD